MNAPTNLSTKRERAHGPRVYDYNDWVRDGWEARKRARSGAKSQCSPWSSPSFRPVDKRHQHLTSSLEFKSATSCIGEEHCSFLSDDDSPSTELDLLDMEESSSCDSVENTKTEASTSLRLPLSQIHKSDSNSLYSTGRTSRTPFTIVAPPPIIFRARGRRTYGRDTRRDSDIQRAQEPIHFQVIDGQSFCLVEGIKKCDRQCHLSQVLCGGDDDESHLALPKFGRSMELLPTKSLPGTWMASIKDQNNKTCYVSALSRETALDLAGKRISLRHESTTETIGPLDAKKKKAIFPNIETIIIHPLEQYRVPYTGEEEDEENTNSSLPSPIFDPFLGCLSIASFNGFSSKSEFDANGAALAQRILGSCCKPEAIGDVAPNLLTVRDFSGSSSNSSIDGSGGIAMMLAMRLDQVDYSVLVGRDTISDTVVAIDVLFTSKGRTSLNSSETTSSSTIALTEQNLSAMGVPTLSSNENDPMQLKPSSMNLCDSKDSVVLAEKSRDMVATLGPPASSSKLSNALNAKQAPAAGTRGPLGELSSVAKFGREQELSHAVLPGKSPVQSTAQSSLGVVPSSRSTLNHTTLAPDTRSGTVQDNTRIQAVKSPVHIVGHSSSIVPYLSTRKDPRPTEHEKRGHHAVRSSSVVKSVTTKAPVREPPTKDRALKSCIQKDNPQTPALPQRSGITGLRLPKVTPAGALAVKMLKPLDSPLSPRRNDDGTSFHHDDTDDHQEQDLVSLNAPWTPAYLAVPRNSHHTEPIGGPFTPTKQARNNIDVMVPNNHHWQEAWNSIPSFHGVFYGIYDEEEIEYYEPPDRSDISATFMDDLDQREHYSLEDFIIDWVVPFVSTLCFAWLVWNYGWKVMDQLYPATPAYHWSQWVPVSAANLIGLSRLWN